MKLIALLACLGLMVAVPTVAGATFTMTGPRYRPLRRRRWSLIAHPALAFNAEGGGRPLANVRASIMDW